MLVTWFKLMYVTWFKFSNTVTWFKVSNTGYLIQGFLVIFVSVKATSQRNSLYLGVTIDSL